MGNKACVNCFAPLAGGPFCGHCGFDNGAYQPEPHHLRPGTVLCGRYVIGRAMGQGGFGITYAGFDTNMNRRVAIKEFYPNGFASRDASQTAVVTCTGTGNIAENYRLGVNKCIQEARSLAQLDDIPGVVRGLDQFQANNTAYIIMEFVEGVTLSDYLRRLPQRPDFRQAVELLFPIGNALQKVHERGYVHRDVSPDNIMINSKGELRLLDFGAVKMVVSDDGGKTEHPIIKRGFSPMEMYSTDGEIGPWSDEYAYCATLYYMITGYKVDEPTRRIYDDTIDANLANVVTDEQREVLKKGLALQPNARYLDIKVLLDQLNLFRGQKNDPPPWKKIIIAAAAVVLCIVLCIGVGKGLHYLFHFEGPTETTTEVIIDDTTQSTTEPQRSVSRVLMGFKVYGDTSVFGSKEYKRGEIISVEFYDSLSSKPSSGAWDVSAQQDGSVYAWVEPEQGGYALYIAANGKVISNQNCSRMFSGYAFNNEDKLDAYCNLRSVKFNNALDTSNVTDMSYMFYDCEVLQTLDFSGFDTANVADMSWMFYGCEAMQTIDVSVFDTSRVTDMGYMFTGCKALETIDISGFDTSNVTDMGRMFFGCKALETIDISGFDTSRVTGMGDMFNGCEALQTLDVSVFNTSRVTTMDSMFSDCKALQSLDLRSFNTSRVTTMSHMFTGCEALQLLDLRSFDTSNVTDMGRMFFGCKAMETLDVSGFDTSKVTDMSDMFCFCNALQKLDLSVFDTSRVTDMGDMFNGCEALQTLDVSGFDTSNVTDMVNMFYECKALQSLDLRSFDTSKVTNMSCMFSSCEALQTLDVSGFNTSKVTDIWGMFADCEALQTLDVSGFDTSKVTKMSYMFADCEVLQTLDVSGFDTSKVTDMCGMFRNCKTLQMLDLRSFSSKSLDQYENMFFGTKCEIQVDQSKFTIPIEQKQSLFL